MTAARKSLEYSLIVFLEKIRLDSSCESSAGQRIHMKYQVLFSPKDKIKKKIINMSPATFLLVSLRVKNDKNKKRIKKSIVSYNCSKLVTYFFLKYPMVKLLHAKHSIDMNRLAPVDKTYFLYIFPDMMLV